MYTQCPDCEIAFKVTADVLKQAAGKVRCGGCGNAFNALLYLSEQMPSRPVAQEMDAALPELRPEIIETDSPLPKTISAEQSAALLKTLDQLAGSDIRIEDTGVEWRVLDEQDAAEPAADDDDAGPDLMLQNVDEFLDDDPTPIDEFLTATPEVVDSPEIFADAGFGKTAVEELRFDDNTPLPDDFDLDDESSYLPEPEADAGVEAEVSEPVMAEVQPDFALSEPDEWTDILGEFQDLVEEVSAPLEVAEETLAETGSGEQPLDMDTQFALQAEAMGIDLSGIHQTADNPEFSESAAFDEELEAAANKEQQQDDIENLQAELDGFEAELEDELEEELEDEFEDDLEAELDEALDAELDDEPEDDTDDEIEDEDEDDLDDVISQLELIDDEVDEPEELIEEPIVANHTIEEELAHLDDEPRAAEAEADPESVEHYVPPMTEEEHTVNMQIDQDLMALAIEDEDGFASTIIIPDKDAEQMVLKENADNSELQDDDADAEERPGFETIIMEGEFIRSALDSEKLAADAAAAATLAELGRNNEADQASRSGGKRYAMVAGVVLLALLFVVQWMHQSREALATIPAFSNTIGQVYRVLGQPVQPAWNVAGWRIEASSDAIEVKEGEENLTVSSRIGNNSDQAMPYPLIYISLTDRFLEPVGSQVLDPAEYLPTDLDPRKLVQPGNTFNAIITIKSPPQEASGYKVDVCYRQTGDQLRCAIDDFK
jgi:predicted Zn finger-like uncharacterized protein